MCVAYRMCVGSGKTGTGGGWLTDARVASTLRGLLGGTEGPGVTDGARHCVSSVVPVCTPVHRDPTARLTPTTPAPRAGVRDAGPGVGGMDKPAVLAARMLAGGTPRTPLGTCPSDRIGTQWHSALSRSPANYLISNAPRVTRTPALLIRSRTPNPQVRGFSRSSGAVRPGIPQENHPEIDQIGTTLAQPEFARNFFLARTDRAMPACGDTPRGVPSPESERGAGYPGGGHDG